MLFLKNFLVLISKSLFFVPSMLFFKNSIPFLFYTCSIKEDTKIVVLWKSSPHLSLSVQCKQLRFFQVFFLVLVFLWALTWILQALLELLMILDCVFLFKRGARRIWLKLWACGQSLSTGGCSVKLSGFPLQDRWVCSLGRNRFSRKDLSTFYLEGSAWWLYFEPRGWGLGTCVSTFTRFIFTLYYFFFFFFSQCGAPPFQGRSLSCYFRVGKGQSGRLVEWRCIYPILNQLSSHPVIFQSHFYLYFQRYLMLPFPEPLRGSVNVLTHHFGSCFYLGIQLSYVSHISYGLYSYFPVLKFLLLSLNVFVLFGFVKKKKNPSTIILVTFGKGISRILEEDVLQLYFFNSIPIEFQFYRFLCVCPCWLNFIRKRT